MVDWTGMEWNGMAGCNFVINFVGVIELCPFSRPVDPMWTSAMTSGSKDTTHR